jgi:prolyl-tRNA editing enzyme YbaK/EbsC (Cys-tRNA(Pro) deacylase)
MKTAFIICGALGHEVLAISKKYDWGVKIFGIPATVHLFPERIAPAVEKRYLAIKDDFDRVIVLFGDCGSYGAVDEMLTRHNLERIDGPHCYEMYGGNLFQELMDEEPGTYFLTDFMVRGFRGTILKGMGLDRFPELKDVYFRNYKRIVFLMQKRDDALVSQAEQAADYLGLPLEIRYTGYGLFEKRLVTMMNQEIPDTKVIALLEENQVPYRLLPHAEPVFTVETAAAQRGVVGEEMVKSILLKEKTGARRYVMACVLGESRLDPKAVRDYLAADWRRLSFASAEEILQVAGYTQGAVAPLCLPDEVLVVFDEAIAHCQNVNISSGDLMFGIELIAQDLIRLAKAQFAPIVV